ncbi:MAG: DUF177 domain-containing protein, partial [Xanthobacteraceae bacterium]|nr:DUF177 domain-containing protein [Xanthobacteraceae bacterium]
MIERTPPERSAKAGGKKADRPSAQTAPPWSVPVVVAEVPDTGRSLELAPDEAQRKVVAAAADILELPRFAASFDLTRHGADGLRVAGHVSATVIQRCVVTLEPVENQIDEDIDLLFQPQAEVPIAPAADAGHQGLEAEEPPEVLHGGVVDLGAVATEFLMLGIDPYPRKPGAVFEAPPAGDPASHPFAALAALKKDGG